MKKALEWRQDYVPTHKQQILHTVNANQILFGGAAGGGKTKAVIEDMVAFCLDNPGLQVYVFRRNYQELEKTIMLAMRDMMPKEIGYLQPTGYKFQFYNNSVIYYCHCSDENDVDKYLGAEIHALYVDEAVLMTPYQLKMLMSRLRLGNYAAKLEAYDRERAAQGRTPQRQLFPRLVFTTNPVGGPSRGFLKKKFVDPYPPLTLFYDKTTEYIDENGVIQPGKRTIFIPSTIRDNPHLDKEYSGVFTDMSPERARALRDGDWDVIEGSVLPGLSRDKHEIPRFKIPRHWTHFMAMDWGTAKPFSVGWYAVSDGIILSRGDKRDWVIPPGAIIRYHEWYGWTGAEDTGIRWDSAQVAKRILEIEKEQDMPPMSYRVADYQMWAQSDGPSPRERMYEATGGKIILQQAKKDRRANYHEWLARLKGSDDHTDPSTGEPLPMLYFMEGANSQMWRTIPNLKLDDNEPDKGPADRQEDHTYDEIGYSIRSRPSITSKDDVRTRLIEEARYKTKMAKPFY